MWAIDFANFSTLTRKPPGKPRGGGTARAEAKVAADRPEKPGFTKAAAGPPFGATVPCGVREGLS